MNGRKYALVLGILLGIVYLNFFAFKGYFEIELGTHSDRPTDFKVYWAKSDDDYVKSQSKRVRIGSGDGYRWQHVLALLGRQPGVGIRFGR